ncbi:Six-hairpin glycosidase-like protein [Xylariaceae sp. FL1272]|nr:Six-hairpin glycosidase-like protein [Xylariaceae sp. FL1272]
MSKMSSSCKNFKSTIPPQQTMNLLPQHNGGSKEEKTRGGHAVYLSDMPSARSLWLKVMAIIFIPLILMTGIRSTRVACDRPSASVSSSPGRKVARAELTGTSFLDHDKPISSYFGQTFLKDNIPYLDIPDSLIQDVYYYRWSAIQRHLRYVLPGTGYMLTEFMQSVGYAKAFGTIDAAAGHQIDESRWLRNLAFGDDYIQLYTRGPADPLQYTQWILDAMSRRAMVTGDEKFLTTQLDDMIRIWHLWDNSFDANAGLYYYEPNWDAQEFSLPGFVADADGTNSTLRLNGPDTFRPSHNAYMVANARAIARAANLIKDGFNDDKFTELADNIESAMYKHLWAPEQEFFMDIIRPNNPDFTPLTGREAIGLYPYRFGIGLNQSYSQPALDQLFDPEGFLAPYGPTTLEIRDPWYSATKVDDGYCCWWNGQSWPFTTSHVLKSMAAIYQAGNTDMTADQYVDYLRTYAITQQKEGKPYVAESHYPLMDSWSADSSNHSENYDHSTNNDDVITGLLGIMPQADDTLRIAPIVPDNWTYFALENLPYHGHLVTVLYDQDGSRYDTGSSGLSVYVDGSIVHNDEAKQATVTIPTANAPETAPVNIAVNPTGPGYYPMAGASYTYETDYEFKAIDGVVFYDDIPDNRWTNYQSPNDNDTLTVTFARPRNISSITIALYSDAARGGSVDLPSKVEIYGSNGLIKTVDDSSELLANDKTEITFDTVETTYFAVNLFRKDSDTWVGVCEVEAWTAPVSGPIYYAVDAYLTGLTTKVEFDSLSAATSNGAVVAGVQTDSNIAFSGIESEGGNVTLTLSYANSGTASANLTILVNQVSSGSLALAPTAGDYATAQIDIKLAVGKNYVSLVGGLDGTDLKVETMTISS